MGERITPPYLRKVVPTLIFLLYACPAQLQSWRVGLQGRARKPDAPARGRTPLLPPAEEAEEQRQQGPPRRLAGDAQLAAHQIDQPLDLPGTQAHRPARPVQLVQAAEQL